jgi:hypothetical protein
VTSASHDIEQIRDDMAHIRMKMYNDIRGVVQGAEAATDWRSYVSHYPLLFLGTAFGIGYLLVPRPSIHSAAEAAAATAAEKVGEDVARRLSTPKKRSWLGWGLSLLGPIAWKAVQGYALQFIDGLIAQPPEGGPPPESETSPWRSSASQQPAQTAAQHFRNR